MKPLVHGSRVARVVFGAGSIERIDAELELVDARRALVITTPGRAALAQRVTALLGSRAVGTFDRAEVHVPGAIADVARKTAHDLGADCLVAIGGGSAIGVAKAVALSTSLGIIAVPTTYSGSEMTPIWGVTTGGAKETGRNPAVLPQVVIYDPLLTVDLPVGVSSASGMNAMAHAMEALYAVDANPLASAGATEALRALAGALPRIAGDPADLVARTSALHGAWLAGSALATVQMALHHKLCHTLGGSFNLPHAETHAVLLPYTAAYNRGAATEAMMQAAQAMGVADAPSGLLTLAQGLPMPQTLAALGMREADLDRATDLAVEKPYPNPRPVTRDGIRALLAAAYEGDAAYVTARTAD